MVDSMSATSSRLRRLAVGTTTASTPGSDIAFGRAVERDLAGDARRQPVGRADRAAVAPQDLRRRAARSRRRARRSGRGCSSPSGSSKLPRAWPSMSSSSPDRPPRASRRWRSRLAEKRGGTVINADAMQTYDAFPILTAQPTPEERARVPHRLYGVLPLSETLSAARWRDLASAEIERCEVRADPVRRLGPVPADPDAGNFRHSRYCPPRCATRRMPTGTRWAPRPSARGWPNAIPGSSRG